MYLLHVGRFRILLAVMYIDIWEAVNMHDSMCFQTCKRKCHFALNRAIGLHPCICILSTHIAFSWILLVYDMSTGCRRGVVHLSGAGSAMRQGAERSQPEGGVAGADFLLYA